MQLKSTIVAVVLLSSSFGLSGCGGQVESIHGDEPKSLNQVQGAVSSDPETLAEDDPAIGDTDDESEYEVTKAELTSICGSGYRSIASYRLRDSAGATAPARLKVFHKAGHLCAITRVRARLRDHKHYLYAYIHSSQGMKDDYGKYFDYAGPVHVPFSAGTCWRAVGYIRWRDVWYTADQNPCID